MYIYASAHFSIYGYAAAALKTANPAALPGC